MRRSEIKGMSFASLLVESVYSGDGDESGQQESFTGGYDEVSAQCRREAYETERDDMRMKQDGLYEKLRQYSASDAYPWHMPGHKRRLVEFADPFSMDITEIDGFDDLHHPEGILKEAMEEAAEFYGAKKTYFLVNGSSCGILAAISAAVKPGEKLLLARNCHKSAYHGALLCQAQVRYVYPHLETEGFYGALDPEMVEREMKQDPALRVVMMVSPTYEGIVSDIRKIADVVHRHGGILLVDEAHGAHFPYGKGMGFPESALDLGADVVIQSLHKTLPSLTQTALLHVGKQSRMDISRIAFYLRVYQSSSPSYILMASIDQCIRLMAGEEGKVRMEWYADRIKKFRDRLRHSLNCLYLYEPEVLNKEALNCEKPALGCEEAMLNCEKSAWECGKAAFGCEENSGIHKKKEYGVPAYDPSKLVVLAPEGRDGNWLAETLRRDWHLEPEMTADRYVILMTSPADTEEGFDRLFYALTEMDRAAKLWITEATDKKSVDSSIIGADMYTCVGSELSKGIGHVGSELSESIDHVGPELSEGIGHVKSELSDTGKDTGRGRRRGLILEQELPDQAPEAVMTSLEAFGTRKENVNLAEAAGRICHDFIYIYPPGIPLLVPGERIEERHIRLIRQWMEHGLEVHGVEAGQIGCIGI